ncbi:MAG: hypothetical protein WD403_13955 [Pirellulales bacterium]
MRFLLGFFGGAIAILALASPGLNQRTARRSLRPPVKPRPLNRLSAYYRINLN